MLWVLRITVRITLTSQKKTGFIYKFQIHQNTKLRQDLNPSSCSSLVLGWRTRKYICCRTVRLVEL